MPLALAAIPSLSYLLSPTWILIESLKAPIAGALSDGDCLLFFFFYVLGITSEASHCSVSKQCRCFLSWDPPSILSITPRCGGPSVLAARTFSDFGCNDVATCICLRSGGLAMVCIYDVIALCEQKKASLVQSVYSDFAMFLSVSDR
jgi:hypothetical protein